MPCMLNTALSHGLVVSISLRRSYTRIAPLSKLAYLHLQNPIMLRSAPSVLPVGPSHAATPLPTAGGRPPSHPSHTAFGTSGGPSGGVEGVESRARRARSGEGRACRPRPRAPSPARPGRPDRPGSAVPVAASRLPGAHARDPPSRRAWPLRSPSVKARHAPSPQIPPLRSGIGGDAGGVPPPARTGL